MNFSDEGEHAANMKRENKAYSYQEQLQEMQLRRELAEKKRKEGKLTTKQKQVMDKELASEKAVREEIRALYQEAEQRLAETRAMVLADHHGAFLRWELSPSFPNELSIQIVYSLQHLSSSDPKQPDLGRSGPTLPGLPGRGLPSQR